MVNSFLFLPRLGSLDFHWFISLSRDCHLCSWNNFHRYHRLPRHRWLLSMLMRAMATALTCSEHKFTLRRPSNTVRLHTGHQGQYFFQRSWRWPNFPVQHFFLSVSTVLRHVTRFCDGARGRAPTHASSTWLFHAGVLLAFTRTQNVYGRLLSHFGMVFFPCQSSSCPRICLHWKAHSRTAPGCSKGSSFISSKLLYMLLIITVPGIVADGSDSSPVAFQVRRTPLTLMTSLYKRDTVVVASGRVFRLAVSLSIMSVS